MYIYIYINIYVYTISPREFANYLKSAYIYVHICIYMNPYIYI